MVFENIYEAGWIVKHRFMGFILGAAYALFGIFAARIIFGNPASRSYIGFEFADSAD